MKAINETLPTLKDSRIRKRLKNEDPQFYEILRLIEVQKRFNLPFKLKEMFPYDKLFVADLQIGDTVVFTNDDPISITHMGYYGPFDVFYLYAIVNNHDCLVQWQDLNWYRSHYVNNDEIPRCDALERLFPICGMVRDVDFEFLHNHTFKVDGYCYVERYVYGLTETGETYKKFRKPLYKICDHE